MAEEASQTIPPVEYRRLGKSGLRVSVPIVSDFSSGFRVLAVLSNDVSFHLARCHVARKYEMAGDYTILAHEKTMSVLTMHVALGCW